MCLGLVGNSGRHVRDVPVKVSIIESTIETPELELLERKLGLVYLFLVIDYCLAFYNCDYNVSIVGD